MHARMLQITPNQGMTRPDELAEVQAKPKGWTSIKMRSSKSRSRSKNNRNRSVGNIMNRVFDSSGPEGKVRGTPQQIIEKYNQLARDAQLANDIVAAENFQQHAEHYLRLLGEAQREMEVRREQQEQQQRERQQARAEQQQQRRQQGGGEPAVADPSLSEQPDILMPLPEEADILVETPENAPKRSRRSGRRTAGKSEARSRDQGPADAAPSEAGPAAKPDEAQKPASEQPATTDDPAKAAE